MVIKFPNTLTSRSFLTSLDCILNLSNLLHIGIQINLTLASNQYHEGVRGSLLLLLLLLLIVFVALTFIKSTVFLGYYIIY